jgi:hypothetical protein
MNKKLNSFMNNKFNSFSKSEKSLKKVNTLVFCLFVEHLITKMSDKILNLIFFFFLFF